MGLVAGALLLVPGTAEAVQRDLGAAEPFFDSRSDVRAQAARTGRATVATARPARATPRARGSLLDRLGRQGVLNVDALTGTPRQLLRTDGA